MVPALANTLPLGSTTSFTTLTVGSIIHRSSLLAGGRLCIVWLFQKRATAASCLAFQSMAKALGGTVANTGGREFGRTPFTPSRVWDAVHPEGTP